MMASDRYGGLVPQGLIGQEETSLITFTAYVLLRLSYFQPDL